MTTDGLEIVYYDGKKMDAWTLAFIKAMEAALGYDLSITQGCYNAGGVAASAGTHDRGGVIDLRAWDWQRKVRVARDLGAAAWHRLPSQGPWVEHIHLVIAGHPNLAPAAARQVVSYNAGRNGLASNAIDSDPYRPNPLPIFAYPPTPEVPDVPETNVSKAGAKLAEAYDLLGDAYQLLDTVVKPRPVAESFKDDLRGVRDQLSTVMDGLPKR